MAFQVRSYRAVALTFLTLALLGTAFYVVLPFLPAILWAIVLAVLLYPLHERFRRRMHEAASALLTTVIAILLILIPFTIAATALFIQGRDFARQVVAESDDAEGKITIDALVKFVDTHATPIIEPFVDDFGPREWYEGNREEIGRQLTRIGGKFAYQVTFGTLTLVIALLTMFFLLRDGHRVLNPALELIPLPREDALRVLTKVRDTIQAVFVGVVLVGLIQATLAGIGYWVAGVENPFVWYVATVALCMFPLLGAPVIYIPLGIALIATDRVWAGVGLLAWGFLVVSQIDNVLRPWIIGLRSQVHPMAIFFALIGGVLAFGPLGIMVGPMLLAVLLGLQDVVRLSHSRARPADSPESPALAALEGAPAPPPER